MSGPGNALALCFLPQPGSAHRVPKARCKVLRSLSQDEQGASCVFRLVTAEQKHSLVSPLSLSLRPGKNTWDGQVSLGRNPSCCTLGAGGHGEVHGQLPVPGCDRKHWRGGNSLALAVSQFIPSRSPESGDNIIHSSLSAFRKRGEVIKAP